MRCPFCGSENTQVKDSRATEDRSAIRRRRFCEECGSRFTTFERIQIRDITVIKRNGNRVPFDREKLLKSIKLASRKRSIDDIKLEKIVNSIQRQIEVSGDEEIKAEEIGEIVMDNLSIIDDVAYIRFASVYKDFADVADFKRFIDAIKDDKQQREQMMKKRLDIDSNNNNKKILKKDLFG
jgi:transcriptional repressor NrdR